MFQVKIRAFVDHQPGDLIPVDRIGALFNPITEMKQQSYPAVAAETNIKRVYAELEPLKSTFALREQIFTNEVAVERPSWPTTKSRFVTIPQFLDLNREVLTELDREATEQIPKLSSESIIRALYNDIETSHLEYSELLNASEASRILAKEKSFLVCSTDVVNGTPSPTYSWRLLGILLQISSSFVFWFLAFL